MFGYRLIHKDELNRLRQVDDTVNRLAEAHRWLSEFDWFLSPMWEYLFTRQPRFGGDISATRDKMRAAIKPKEPR